MLTKFVEHDTEPIHSAVHVKKVIEEKTNLLRRKIFPLTHSTNLLSSKKLKSGHLGESKHRKLILTMLLEWRKVM